MSVSTGGLTTVTVERPNGAAIKVPADAFSWIKSTDTKVEAVIKPTTKFKNLFGG